MTPIQASIEPDLILKIAHTESEGAEDRRLVIIDILMLTHAFIFNGV